MFHRPTTSRVDACRRPARWWCAGLVAIMLAGCDSDETNLTEWRLQQVATAYLNYTVATGRPPQAESVLVEQLGHLVPFLDQGRPGSQGEASELFCSHRDGAPFVVCYGVNLCLDRHASEVPVIAYEQQGADGSRYVAFANGKVECLKEEEVANLIDPL